MAGELWKMDCAQCDVFRTCPTDDGARALRDQHQEDTGHTSAIVTKIRKPAWQPQ